MMNSEHVNKNVQKYINENCLRLNPIEKKLVELTTKQQQQQQCGQNPNTGCCHHECSKLMNVLVKITNPRKLLEIGTLNGLTTLNMGLGLTNDAQLVTLVGQNEKNIPLIRNVWKEAGIDQRIQVRNGETVELLEKIKLEAGSGLGKWDMISLNEINKNVQNVVERCIGLLRPGGVICIHHVLWNGNVWNLNAKDEETVAIRELNRCLRDDKRVELVTLPIGDGLTLITKNA